MSTKQPGSEKKRVSLFSEAEQIRLDKAAASALNEIPSARLYFNLNRDNQLNFGLLCVLEHKIVVFFEENHIEYSRDELSDYRIERGVGVIAMEAKLRNEDIELCRADMRACKEFERTAGMLASKDFLDEKREHRPEKGDHPSAGPGGQPFPEPGPPPFFDSKDALKGIKTGRLLLRIGKFAEKDMALLVLAGLLMLCTSGISVLLPQIQSFLVDGFLQPVEGAGNSWIASLATNFGIQVETVGGLLAVVGIIAFCGLLTAILGCLRGVVIAKASANIIQRVRDQLYRKIQNLSLAGFSKRTPGDLITCLSRDTEQMRRFLVELVPSLLQEIVMFVSITVILLIADWKLTLLLIIPIPLLFLLFSSVRKVTRSLHHRERQLDREANDMLHDVFSGIREVKVFGTESRESLRFDSCAKRIAQNNKRAELIWNIVIPFSSFLLSIGEFIVLVVVGSRVFQGVSTLGQLTLFLSYVSTLYEPIRWLARMPRMLAVTLTSISKVVELLDDPETMATGTVPCEKLRGKLEFKNVYFGYNPPDYVLKDINLSVKPGEFVGLVGRSGVGKSTLINLAMRMYECNEGTILVDGKDIRTLDSESYRSQIGVVLQETYLFNGTIYSNLIYANPNASRDEVIQAAKAAGAHEFIMKLPDGYNTYVGQRGNTLSGGEKQRIAIARAMLRNPNLLILDEATSSLDTETEKRIQTALQVLSQGRTTIAIAHRLSTLRNATRLVVFEKGQIEEIGTHEELMEKQGRYYRLIMAQREMNRMAK